MERRRINPLLLASLFALDTPEQREQLKEWEHEPRQPVPQRLVEGKITRAEEKRERRRQLRLMHR